MVLAAEGEIRSWPVTVVQLQSAAVSSARVMVVQLDWDANKFVSGHVNRKPNKQLPQTMSDTF